MDTAINFLATNYPWILVIFVAIVATAWVTYYVVKRLHSIKQVKNDLEDFKTVADCKLHHQSIENTKDDVQSIKNDIQSVLAGISNIKNAIVSIKPATASLFAQSNSPLQLNEKGRILFESSGADVILEGNSDQWLEKLRQMGLKTALDVEEQSRLFLLGLIDDDIFIPLKNYVYSHPRIEEIPVSMNDICFVMSLELRNRYLDAYPSILQEIPITNR